MIFHFKSDFLNFSGGKDSTYLLLEMIRRELPFDAVLHVETGMDFPAMCEHINRVEDFLWTERRMRLTRLRSPRSFEQLMFSAAKSDGTRGYGWPGAKVRWCTGQLKTHVIQAYNKTLPVLPQHYIAIAADEASRLKRRCNQDPLHRHPLIEWGITEAEALAGCYRAGYDWGGLYERFRRVSCWCCPMQSLHELRTLRAHYPDIWAKLRALDDQAIAQFGWDNAYGRFRSRESVRMLEVRFDFEAYWEAMGCNIRSKAFYRQLRHLYEERFGLPSDSPANELLRYLTVDDLLLSVMEQPPKERRGKRQLIR